MRWLIDGALEVWPITLWLSVTLLIWIGAVVLDEWGVKVDWSGVPLIAFMWPMVVMFFAIAGPIVGANHLLRFATRSVKRRVVPPPKPVTPPDPYRVAAEREVEGLLRASEAQHVPASTSSENSSLLAGEDVE